MPDQQHLQQFPGSASASAAVNGEGRVRCPQMSSTPSFTEALHQLHKERFAIEQALKQETVAEQAQKLGWLQQLYDNLVTHPDAFATLNNVQQLAAVQEWLNTTAETLGISGSDIDAARRQHQATCNVVPENCACTQQEPGRRKISSKQGKMQRLGLKTRVAGVLGRLRQRVTLID